MRAVDSQNGKIGIRIVTDEICAVRPAVDERRRDGLRLGDDVAVGEHEAVGREDETGTAASTFDVDLHDGRTDTFHGLNHREGVRIEEYGVVEWFRGNHVTLSLRPDEAVRIPRSGRSRRSGQPAPGPSRVNKRLDRVPGMVFERRP